MNAEQVLRRLALHLLGEVFARFRRFEMRLDLVERVHGFRPDRLNHDKRESDGDAFEHSQFHQPFSISSAAACTRLSPATTMRPPACAGPFSQVVTMPPAPVMIGISGTMSCGLSSVSMMRSICPASSMQ